MNEITFVMIVKNGMKTLPDTLFPLKTWPHVVVADTGSEDGTWEYLQTCSFVKSYKISFDGFGDARNEASNLAKTKWVFHLDADEVPSLELLEELKSLNLDDKSVYKVQRHNIFWNKHMKGCSGWHPDFVIRLLQKIKHDIPKT